MGPLILNTKFLIIKTLTCTHYTIKSEDVRFSHAFAHVQLNGLNNDNVKETIQTLFHLGNAFNFPRYKEDGA